MVELEYTSYLKFDGESLRVRISPCPPFLHKINCNKAFSIYQNNRINNSRRFLMNERYDTYINQARKRCNDTVSSIMTGILLAFKDSRLMPSGIHIDDESFTVYFIYKKYYADIQCFNNGEILGVLSDKRNDPMVWTIRNTPQEISDACTKITNFIHSANTTEKDLTNSFILWYTKLYKKIFFKLLNLQ